MPPKKNPEEITTAIAQVKLWHTLREQGLTSEQAADRVGLEKSTLVKYRTRYCPELTLTKQIFGKNGELRNEVHGIRENSDVDTTGMRIKSVTTSPYGGAYVKYETEKEFLNDEYWSNLKEVFSKSIRPHKPKPRKGKGTLKIFTADKHVGADVEDVAIYQNEYSAEIYRKRMAKILDEISYIGTDYETVVLFDLGDNLDGYHSQTTRGGHHLPQNMTTREQFDTFLEVERWFIDSLVDMLSPKNMHYIATSDDNHSGAFGYSAYKALELYISLKYPFIKTHVSKKFIDHVVIDGETIVYTHGKDEHDRKTGLPLNLSPRVETQFLDYMRQNNIHGRAKVIKADLHQFNINAGKFFDYINVPSVFGCSKWIMSNFGYTRPGAYLESDNRQIPIWFA